MSMTGNNPKSEVLRRPERRRRCCGGGKDRHRGGDSRASERTHLKIQPVAVAIETTRACIPNGDGTQFVAFTHMGANSE